MKLHTHRYPRDSTDLNPNQPHLIFLHGMGGTGNLWRPIASSLEDHTQILCPDQRGHGGSRPVPDPQDFSPKSFAQDVIDTCIPLGFTPAWVIGHSMGVRTACGYAKLNPEGTTGLILVDLGFSGVAGGGIGDLLYTFLGHLPNEFNSRSEARAFLENHCPDASIAQYLLAVSVPNLKTGTVSFPFDHESLLKTIEASRNHPTREWLLEFARTTGKPVHVLRGANSRVFSKIEFEKEKAAFHGISNVQFHEVPGAGHGLPFEKRVEFVGMIRKWIEI